MCMHKVDREVCIMAVYWESSEELVGYNGIDQSGFTRAAGSSSSSSLQAAQSAPAVGRGDDVTEWSLSLCEACKVDVQRGGYGCGEGGGLYYLSVPRPMYYSIHLIVGMDVIPIPIEESRPYKIPSMRPIEAFLFIY